MRKSWIQFLLPPFFILKKIPGSLNPNKEIRADRQFDRLILLNYDFALFALGIEEKF